MPCQAGLYFCCYCSQLSWKCRLKGTALFKKLDSASSELLTYCQNPRFLWLKWLNTNFQKLFPVKVFQPALLATKMQFYQKKILRAWCWFPDGWGMLKNWIKTKYLQISEMFVHLLSETGYCRLMTLAWKLPGFLAASVSPFHSFLKTHFWRCPLPPPRSLKSIWLEGTFHLLPSRLGEDDNSPTAALEGSFYSANSGGFRRVTVQRGQPT